MAAAWAELRRPRASWLRELAAACDRDVPTQEPVALGGARHGHARPARRRAAGAAMSDVAAVVVGVPRDGLPAVDVGEVAQATTLAGIRSAAERLHAPLLWLLDASASPASGALAALL